MRFCFETIALLLLILLLTVFIMDYWFPIYPAARSVEGYIIPLLRINGWPIFISRLHISYFEIECQYTNRRSLTLAETRVA